MDFNQVQSILGKLLNMESVAWESYLRQHSQYITIFFDWLWTL